MRIGSCCLALILVLSAIASLAQPPAFDLVGPNLDVRVTRGSKKLPISQVPNLKQGDRLWIHPDLPDSQSAHYLLVVAFLRGATNPPPNNWFTLAETWKKTVRQEGVVVTVPEEAQQVVVFLAPDTGGAFSTLRTAVRGRPGMFVRAVQDLQQASLDRQRLDRYLKEIKSTSEYDPKELHERSLLLARSLSMKLDPQCFDRPSIQQASCLTQNTDQLVLDDAHSQSMVAQLANGATADLMNQIGYSRLAGGGAYSPYIGAVVDLARILGGIHSAQYQYIPALALPLKDTLHLRLNNPPSFRNPKSVLVVALPPVQDAQTPPLRPVEQSQKYCAQKPSLVLPVEGAPLIFATQLAHHMVLKVTNKSGQAIEAPVEADPAQGGFVVDTRALKPDLLAPETTGALHGMWGFDAMEGPNFSLRSSHPQTWSAAAKEASALVAGRDATLHLESENLACVRSVDLRDDSGATRKLEWTIAKSGNLEVHVPLRNAKPGAMTLLISQYGQPKSDELPMRSYSEPASLDLFLLYAGDSKATLTGARLDDVAAVKLGNLQFMPAGLRRVNQKDELTLETAGQSASIAAQQTKAQVTLKDGRQLEVAASVAPPRPKLSLIAKEVQYEEGSVPRIQLSSPDDLPGTGRLVFFAKSIVPDAFPRTQTIELAADDGSFHKQLSIADGSLVLQDSKTVMGNVDLARVFGSSAFGPLRLRPVSAEGVPGDWLPIGNLVRLPELGKLRCPRAASELCTLTGTNLFLIAAVSRTQDFTDPIQVPEGSSGSMMPVPHPTGDSFYVKLRDNPASIQKVTLPITYVEAPGKTSEAERR